MKKVILYVATSLDHFIAREDGGVDWLFTDQDYGYWDFYDTIDCTLMGGKTYEKVISFGGKFPYEGKNNFVFTRNSNRLKNPNVKFVSGDIAEFTKELKKQTGKHIWLIGGGEIADQLLRAGIINELVLSIHPILLGSGLPLFKFPMPQQKLKLVESKQFESGLLQLRYMLL